MCQIASVSLRDRSIWATFGPRWRPRRSWCAGSGRGRTGACRRSARPRTAPSAGSAPLEDAGAETGVAAELRRRREVVDVADLGGDREAVDPADPGGGDQQRDVAMVGALALELDGQLGDLHFQVVDQLEAGVDVPAPRVRDRHAVEQLATSVTEQIADRARVAERHQRRVDAVLQRRAVTYQVQPVAGQLALVANARVGQPDRKS